MVKVGMKYWLIFVWKDLEPSIKGPYMERQFRNAAAKKLRKEYGDAHGIYKLDLTDDGPEISTYSGKFFVED